MRKLKVLIAGLTALCMCAAYMPLDENILPEISMLSAHAESSGTCGENLTWVLDDAGTLTISGTGAMTTTGWNGQLISPWKNNNQIKKIIIKDGVTNIGDDAFYGCENLTSVTIPDSVTSIGNFAFECCRSLTSVTIPNSVTSIGDYAFICCDSLRSLTIPDSVTNIGKGAFESCEYLTSMTLPDGITSIGGRIFLGCKRLTSVKIPDSVTSIGDYAFVGCDSLRSLTIPDSVTNIGDYAFYGCDYLISITIPGSVTSIGESAFGECLRLNSVTFLNPECKIYNSKETIYNSYGDVTRAYFFSGTIYGYSNSTAQAYAKEYGRKFIALTGKPETSTTPSTTATTTTTTKRTTGTTPPLVTTTATTTTTKRTTGTTPPLVTATTTTTTTKLNTNTTNTSTSTTTTTTTITTAPEPVTPSREKKFVEGGDNWSFSNSRTNFGGTYFMQDSYYKKLMDGLDNTEKEIIYDTIRNKKWSGSCYGMAVTSILASNSVLNPKDYESGANFLHDVSAPPSDEVKSLINYYFMLQQTNLVSSLSCQAQYEEESDKLKKLVSCLEDKSPTLLSYFGNFFGSKRNFSGHAVVAYDIEYGTYSYDAKAYNGKIKIYDNNAENLTSEYCLYFNDYNWSWTIPYYQIGSDTGAKFGMITDDLSILNYHGYLNETSSTGTVPFIAQLNARELNDHCSVHKVNYTNGVWMNASSADSDDIKPFASMGDESNSDMLFALKDTESGYMMQRTDKAGSMNLSMHYENTLMNIFASKGTEANFAKDGCIALDGENTDYELKIVLNERELVTDWYSFSVNGGNTDAVKLEKTKDGYILTSSDMKNIIAEAYNDEEDAFINFSTDADSVFLYEIDKNTIGVKIDSNGDGTYDKLIAQTPESM